MKRFRVWYGKDPVIVSGDSRKEIIAEVEKKFAVAVSSTRMLKQTDTCPFCENLFGAEKFHTCEVVPSSN